MVPLSPFVIAHLAETPECDLLSVLRVSCQLVLHASHCSIVAVTLFSFPPQNIQFFIDLVRFPVSLAPAKPGDHSQRVCIHAEKHHLVRFSMNARPGT